MGVFDTLEEFAVEVFGLFGLDKNEVVAILFYPLVLESVALSDAGGFLAEDGLKRLLVVDLTVMDKITYG